MTLLQGEGPDKQATLPLEGIHPLYRGRVYALLCRQIARYIFPSPLYKSSAEEYTCNRTQSIA